MKRMKLSGAAAALSLVLILSACGTQPAQTSATSDPSAEQTTAAPSDQQPEATTTTEVLEWAPTYTNADGSLDESNIDVSEETIKALDIIGESAPLLKKYFEDRNKVPLTYETTIKNEDGEYTSNLYIKDSRHLVQYLKDPKGKVTQVIYNFDKAYELDPAEKVAIFQNCGEGTVVETVRNSIVYIYVSDVKEYSYVSGTGTYNGTEYNSVTLKKNGEEGEIVYYFDKDTDQLKYIVTPVSETRIDRFENAFTDDQLLEVPSDYTMKSINEVVGDIQSEIQSQIADSTTAAE